MSQLLPEAAAAVPVFTVDKCQGQDFDCCIISMVRSNERGQIGQLLSDWRRLNASRPPERASCRHEALALSVAALKSVPTLRYDACCAQVAMTRAKTKMILIGSASTLRHSQLLACLLQVCDVLVRCQAPCSPCSLCVAV